MKNRAIAVKAGRAALPFLLTLGLFGIAPAAQVRLTDDAGRIVVLKEPARRIVSLAPHITELVFAAGAGDHLVGAVDFSDYPARAKTIPRVGDSAQLDLERIVALRPDLILVWQHGNGERQLDRMLQLGIPAFFNEPRRMPDIARSIEQLGTLAGTVDAATAAARAFRNRESALAARYSAGTPVRAFYQLWERPLMTVNGEHLISDVMRLCGARNVFAELLPLVPRVSTEAVLAADPELILGATHEMNTRGDLDNWKTWTRLTAVARGNLVLIHSDLLTRPTPRILDAAEQFCARVEAARARRPR